MFLYNISYLLLYHLVEYNVSNNKLNDICICCYNNILHENNRITVDIEL